LKRHTQPKRHTERRTQRGRHLIHSVKIHRRANDRVLIGVTPIEVRRALGVEFQRLGRGLEHEFYVFAVAGLKVIILLCDDGSGEDEDDARCDGGSELGVLA
jgi:hypothetical protein